MFKKILIANRGEIACRVIKTARRLNVQTVAVYSDADANALHVELADEAVHIGASPSRESYLNMQAVIAAALRTGAEAVHPGYGFLSENAEFCRLCQDNNIVFIGPPIAAIEAMGSKSAAKTIMEAAAVPLVPGYHGEDQSPQHLKRKATNMGYPVLLKASAGGGGKGMRAVWSEQEFDEELEAAKREASNAFNDDDMLVEKYLQQPRHVEIQVFFDQHGNGVYLAERDCSVQRRHQKVVEEAPAPGMSTELREAMGETALAAARAIDYEGAGTVEFLLDPDGSFYFMEMNTRLQVEHPVTEMITGQDLVEWQLRVAAGEPLPLQQDQIVISGHAFEARIYAEDPANDFLPVTGILSALNTPPEDRHTRIDTGVREGDEVSIYYDPMIAKLVVWDENRDKALHRMTKALANYRISGMTTNVDFLYNLCSSAPFAAAQLDTGFIEKHHSEIFHDADQDNRQEILQAGLFLMLLQHDEAEDRSENSHDPSSPWNSTDAWRLNESPLQQIALYCPQQDSVVDIQVEHSADNKQGHLQQLHLSIDDTRIAVGGKMQRQSDNSYRLTSVIEGHQSQAEVFAHDGIYSLYSGHSAFQFCINPIHFGDEDENEDNGGLLAPMNGTVVKILIEVGATVEKNQPLLVMEAMKMEYTIRAPADGTVTEIYYQSGDLVDGDAPLLAMDHEE